MTLLKVMSASFFWKLYKRAQDRDDRRDRADVDTGHTNARGRIAEGAGRRREVAQRLAHQVLEHAQDIHVPHRRVLQLSRAQVHLVS